MDKLDVGLLIGLIISMVLLALFAIPIVFGFNMELKTTCSQMGPTNEMGETWLYASYDYMDCKDLMIKLWPNGSAKIDGMTETEKGGWIIIITNKTVT